MSWYDTDWDYRVEITVDNTQVDEDVSDFPVYVDLSDMPVSFFTNVDSAGADIRITRADGTTECAFELVSIDTGASTGELHFKADFLSSSSDTSFKIYYGNASASAYAVTATYGRNNVWTNGFVYVNHMESTTGEDSVGNGGTSTDVGSPSTVSGKLSGNAIEFDGSTQYLYHSDFPELAGISDLGVSVWLNADSYAEASPVCSQSSRVSDRNFWMQIYPNVGFDFYASKDGTGNNDTSMREGASTSLVASQWEHIIGWYDISSAASPDYLFYKNGINWTLSETGDGTPPTTTFNSSADFKIGILGGYGHYFNGKIDELRIFDAQRSSAWLSTEYTNQNTPTTFYTVGSEEAQPTADTFTAKTSIF